MPAACAISLIGSGAMASLMAMSDGTGVSSCSGLSGRGMFGGLGVASTGRTCRKGRAGRFPVG